MFNKDEKTTKEADTIIGQSVKVKGDFDGQGNVIIEGEFEGTLKTTGNLFIGEKAKLITNITCNNAKILGIVQGNLVLNGCLELGKNSVITGDIKASALSVEQGAIIIGSVSIGTSSLQNIAPEAI